MSGDTKDSKLSRPGGERTISNLEKSVEAKGFCRLENQISSGLDVAGLGLNSRHGTVLKVACTTPRADKFLRVS